jgi:hypothetical protein
LRRLDSGNPLRVITDFRTALEGIQDEPRVTVEREIGYFERNQTRLDYAAGRRRGEPVGSGAIESTCRQYQCRFKRTGQFWSRSGDEALLCLETLWRNGRWSRLFPHAGTFDMSRN